MQGVLIFLLSVAGAVLYGVVHDHVTVRICNEYFSVAHDPVWGGTRGPELLAFTWGVIATWWVGAILGIPMALAARVGKLPKISAQGHDSADRHFAFVHGGICGGGGVGELSEIPERAGLSF